MSLLFNMLSRLVITFIPRSLLISWLQSPSAVILEYCSTLKRNEVGSFVEMWMDLESVTQSEVSPLVLDQGIFHGIYNHLASCDGKGHIKESILNLNSSHITGRAEHKRRWRAGLVIFHWYIGLHGSQPAFTAQMIGNVSWLTLQHPLFCRRCASFLYKC